MEADILLSRPVQSLVCRLKRPQDPDYVEEADCENCTIGWAMGGGGGGGHATATLLVHSIYRYLMSRESVVPQHIIVHISPSVHTCAHCTHAQ